MLLKNTDVELLTKSAAKIEELESELKKVAKGKNTEIDELKAKLATAEDENSTMKKEKEINKLLDKLAEKNLLPDKELVEELKAKLKAGGDLDKLAGIIDSLDGKDAGEGILIGDGVSGDAALRTFLTEINQ